MDKMETEYAADAGLSGLSPKSPKPQGDYFSPRPPCDYANLDSESRSRYDSFPKPNTRRPSAVCTLPNGESYLCDSGLDRQVLAKVFSKKMQQTNPTQQLDNMEE